MAVFVLFSVAFFLFPSARADWLGWRLCKSDSQSGSTRQQESKREPWRERDAKRLGLFPKKFLKENAHCQTPTKPLSFVCFGLNFHRKTLQPVLTQRGVVNNIDDDDDNDDSVAIVAVVEFDWWLASSIPVGCDVCSWSLSNNSPTRPTHTPLHLPLFFYPLWPGEVRLNGE